VSECVQRVGDGCQEGWGYYCCVSELALWGRPIISHSDPLGGWNVPVSQKLTQGQKRALKVQQRVAAGIPPQGYRGGNKPNCFGIITVTARHSKKNQYDNSSDYTSSEDDDSSSRQLPLLTGPLEGAQSSETTTLTQLSESPISQVPLLTSNLAATVLTESAVLEHEWLIPLSPNPVDISMAVDAMVPAILSQPDGTIPFDESQLNKL
jgi:hypothetical protein